MKYIGGWNDIPHALDTFVNTRSSVSVAGQVPAIVTEGFEKAFKGVSENRNTLMVLHALSGICCKVDERYWEGKFAAVRQ